MKFLQNRLVQLTVIVIFTLIAYANILNNGLVIDDKAFLFNWQTIKNLQGTVKFFQGDLPVGQEGVYRPIRSVIYAIDYNFFGANPFWYHLQAIFIHLSATIFVYLIIELMLKQGALFSSNQEPTASSKHGLSAGHFLPFAAALLFGLHPIHTETIDYISASLDNWGTLFFFVAFYFYLSGIEPISKSNNFSSLFIKNKSLLISLILALVAFFTYEMTLTLPLLIILYDFCRGRLLFKNKLSQTKKPPKKSKFVYKEIKPILLQKANVYFQIRFYIPYFIIAIFYLAVRFFALGIVNRGPYLAGSFYLTMLIMTKVFLKYMGLLIWPVNLVNNHIISKNIEAFVYRGYQINGIIAKSIISPDIFWSIIILLGLILFAALCFRRYPFISFCIGWFFISLLPVSEIIPQGSVMNERLLYIPSFAFVLIVAIFLNQIFNTRYKYFSLAGLILLSGFYFFLTFKRNQDWHDEIRLWSKDIKSAPTQNAYAYFQLGEIYEQKGDYSLAVFNYQKAYEINPDAAIAIASKARTYEKERQINLAKKTYLETILIDPYFWEAHLNLAAIYLAENKKDLALDEYKKVLEINPNSALAKSQLTALETGKKDKQNNKSKTVKPSKEKSLNSLLSISDANLPALSVFNSQGSFSPSFFLPAGWSKQERNNQVYLADPQGIFNLLFAQDFRSDNLSIQKYLALHQESYGSLQNQGLAQIPNFDTSYVKIFNDNGIQKDQFFLFKDNNVIQILVYPADSPLMREFDKIVQSIQVKNSK